MYQLGERTVRIRKVVGSNPFRSTIKSREIERFRGFLQLIETLMRADFHLNLPPIGSFSRIAYCSSKALCP